MSVLVNCRSVSRHLDSSLKVRTVCFAKGICSVFLAASSELWLVEISRCCVSNCDRLLSPRIIEISVPCDRFCFFDTEACDPLLWPEEEKPLFSSFATSADSLLVAGNTLYGAFWLFVFSSWETLRFVAARGIWWSLRQSYEGMGRC